MEGVACYVCRRQALVQTSVYHVPKFIELGIYALMPRFGPQTRTVALPSFAALKVCHDLGRLHRAVRVAPAIRPFVRTHKRQPGQKLL
jgi:hypothetical protein